MLVSKFLNVSEINFVWFNVGDSTLAQLLLRAKKQLSNFCTITYTYDAFAFAYCIWLRLFLWLLSLGDAESIREFRTWGLRAVPTKCKGLNQDRIDDMIKLFRTAQFAAPRGGDKFNGFFQ